MSRVGCDLILSCTRYTAHDQFVHKTSHCTRTCILVVIVWSMPWGEQRKEGFQQTMLPAPRRSYGILKPVPGPVLSCFLPAAVTYWVSVLNLSPVNEDQEPDSTRCYSMFLCYYSMFSKITNHSKHC